MAIDSTTASLKQLIDAYGVAVRAGVITPQQEDEVAVRELFKLPPMSSGVKAEWVSSGGIRLPITIQTAADEAPALKTTEEEDE